MRIKKYLKHVSSFDIIYRSTNIQNPLKLPMVKKSTYHLQKMNTSQINTDALYLKSSTCLSSSQVQISTSQEMNAQFRGMRNIEKKTNFKMACGSQLTLEFLGFNYANISSKTNTHLSKLKNTRKYKLANIQIQDPAVSSYMHLFKQTGTSNKKTACVVTKGLPDNAYMTISCLMPVASAEKKGAMVNIYRDILQASKA